MCVVSCLVLLRSRNVALVAQIVNWVKNEHRIVAETKLSATTTQYERMAYSCTFPQQVYCGLNHHKILAGPSFPFLSD